MMTHESGSQERLRAARNRRASDALDFGILESSIGYMLRRAQLAAFADFGSGLQSLDLRPGQFGVLAVIGRNPGITQTEVCAALGIQRTNFVAVIDDLEARGLARRSASAHDRRSNALFLTAAGERALGQARAVQRSHEARLARRLGPGGREKLLGLLSRLAGADPATRSPEEA